MRRDGGSNSTSQGMFRNIVEAPTTLRNYPRSRSMHTIRCSSQSTLIPSIELHCTVLYVPL